MSDIFSDTKSVTSVSTFDNESIAGSSSSTSRIPVLGQKRSTRRLSLIQRPPNEALFTVVEDQDRLIRRLRFDLREVTAAANDYLREVEAAEGRAREEREKTEKAEDKCGKLEKQLKEYIAGLEAQLARRDALAAQVESLEADLEDARAEEARREVILADLERRLAEAGDSMETISRMTQLEADVARFREAWETAQARVDELTNEKERGMATPPISAPSSPPRGRGLVAIPEEEPQKAEADVKMRIVDDEDENAEDGKAIPSVTVAERITSPIVDLVDLENANKAAAVEPLSPAIPMITTRSLRSSLMSPTSPSATSVNRSSRSSFDGLPDGASVMSLWKTLAKAEDQNKKQSEEIKRLENRIVELLAKCSILESDALAISASHAAEASALIDRLKGSEETVNKQSEKLKGLEDRITEVLGQCSTLESHLKAVRDEKALLETAKQSLSTRLDEALATVDEGRAHAVEVANLGNRLKGSEATISKQSEEIKRLEDRIAEILGQCSRLEATLNAARDEKLLLETSKQSLSERLDEAVAIADEVRASHAVEIGNAEETISKKSEEIKCLEDRLVEILGQCSTLEGNVNAARDEKVLLETEKKKLSERLDEALAIVDEVRASHAAEAANTTDRLKGSEETISIQLEEIKRLEDRIAEILGRCSALEANANAARDEKVLLEAEKKKLSERLDEALAMVDEVRASHAAEAANTTHRLKGSEETISKQSEEIKCLEDRIAEILGECSTLEAHLNAARDEKALLATAKQSLSERLDETLATVDEGRAHAVEVANLANRLKGSEETISKQSEEIKCLEDRIAEILVQSSSLEANLSAVRDEKVLLETSKENLSTRLDEALAHMDEVRASHTAEVTDLSGRLKASEESLSKLTEELKRLEDRIAEILVQCSSLEANLNAATDEKVLLETSKQNISKRFDEALANMDGVRARHTAEATDLADRLKDSEETINKLTEEIKRRENRIAEIFGQCSTLEAQLKVAKGENALLETTKQSLSQRLDEVLATVDEGRGSPAADLTDRLKGCEEIINKQTEEIKRLEGRIAEIPVQRSSLEVQVNPARQEEVIVETEPDQGAADGIRHRRSRGTPRQSEVAALKTVHHEDEQPGDYFLPSVFFNRPCSPGQLPSESRSPSRILVTRTCTSKKCDKIRHQLESEIENLNGRIARMVKREEELKREVGRGQGDVNEALRRLMEAERERERVEMRVKEMERGIGKRKKKMPWEFCLKDED
ncbi:hypothetical protein BC829DRAFT_421602 [Chytridium lagenaria]|nr:hypothetical protein BC829DRAFT_421602 [Chytridium lagenaria]